MLIVLFVGLFLLFKNKPSGFIPTEDEGRMLVTYEMPEAASTTRSVAMLKDIIARISKIPETRVVGGLAGLNIVSFSTKANAGTIFVNLKSWDDRKGDGQHAQDIMNEIRAATADIKERLYGLPAAVSRLWSTVDLNGPVNVIMRNYCRCFYNS